MTQVQSPSPGQPLDVSYINTLVTSLNQLDNSVSSQNNSASSKVGANTVTARKTSSLAFAAETVSISLSKVDKDNVAYSGTWNNQGVSFTGNPIVVGTIVSTASSVTNRELILIIKSITASATNFEIIAPTAISQSYSISVNFIAIGVTS
jgi:hypothetical protein